MMAGMCVWKDKVAVVTGTSAGIGAAIATALVESGMKVVGLARRKDRLDLLERNCSGKPGKFYGCQTDLTKEDEILKAFNWTTDNVGPISILINNAGIIQKTTLCDGDTEMWKKVFDTNVMSVAIASREAVRIMRANGIDGYIININSISGHSVLDIPYVNLYPASKHAITAMTETLRNELSRLKSNIRVTSISPGVVKTEIAVANDFISEGLYERVRHTMTGLEPHDIAQSVLYVLGTPLHVQVTELSIRPLGETDATLLKEVYGN